MGRPGEAIAGALAERLNCLWGIIMLNVGDDSTEDVRGVYAHSWRQLHWRFRREADYAVECDRWGAIFLPDPARMQAVIEACISAEEL